MTFDIPAHLPDGRRLWTVKEARQHIAGLPPRERASVRWQNALRQLDRCELHATVWKFIAPVAVSRAAHGIEPYALDCPETDGLSKRQRALLDYKAKRAAFKARQG